MTAFNIEDRIQDCIDDLRSNLAAKSYNSILRKHFGDLAPRLTPEEVDAKCKALAASIDESYRGESEHKRGIIASWIAREFSTVTYGDGVDWKERAEAAERDEWKAKYQSAKEELEESEHARHLQIEELASVHSEIEAAERERDDMKQQLALMQYQLDGMTAGLDTARLEREQWNQRAVKAEAERDALAARVRELEGKASALDDMLGLIHALGDANTDDFARREGLHIAALLNHVRDNKKLKARIAELEARHVSDV